jgi:hypothetical protein
VLFSPKAGHCCENNLSAVTATRVSAATNSMSDINQSSNGRSATAERMRLEEQREDPEAVGAAVLRLIRQALDDMRWLPA